MNLTVIKERPILFTADSVEAILEGDKTQSRRVPQIQQFLEVERYERYSDGSYRAIVWKGENVGSFRSRYGGPGDHLWVREAFTHGFFPPKTRGAVQIKRGPVLNNPADNLDGWTECAWYDGDEHPGGWFTREHRVSPRYMPRWASRITLEVKEIRLERLQDVTEDDAVAEGYERREHFIRGWDALNEKRGFEFDANPWVWVISFERIQP